jgi:hypothetical protein
MYFSADALSPGVRFVCNLMDLNLSNTRLCEVAPKTKFAYVPSVPSCHKRSYC